MKSVEPAVGDGYELELRDGSRIEVSRRQLWELRERLSL
ncbi:response regulator receiver domain protein [Lysobacter enzymogenes]|uniref:Response regulator receiver domain protein n=1 Tax=Lysobacter enzymogenes TaxID=69 RepID=A0A0S2DCX9_LYSEN|nr:response regulator receiver domain protein [Lysobacter enzymogenes]